MLISSISLFKIIWNHYCACHLLETRHFVLLTLSWRVWLEEIEWQCKLGTEFRYNFKNVFVFFFGFILIILNKFSCLVIFFTIIHLMKKWHLIINEHLQGNTIMANRWKLQNVENLNMVSLKCIYLYHCCL